jgi:MFS transporter, CP family, cyanate transporter
VSRSGTGPARGTRAFAILALSAIFLTSVNLRPAVTSAGALLRDVQVATGMSGLTAGILTTLPPVCFGAFGLLTGRVARRLGTATTVLGGLLILAVSLVVRTLTDDAWWVVVWTVPALAGMAVGNVLLPVAVKRVFPTRVGRVTGIYSFGLALGTAAAAGVTVPIAQAAGSWRVGLAIWAVPALLAAIPWWWLRPARPGRDLPPAHPGEVARTSPLPGDPSVSVGGPTGTAPPGGADAVAGRPARPSSAPEPSAAGSVPIHRGLQAWGLTGFFGLQSLAAYVIMGWLPSIYQDAGIAPARAGLLLALVVGIGAPISVVLPELAARRPDQRAWVVGLAAMAASAYLGLLFAPAAAPVVWAVLLGTGMGAFPLALVLIGLRALTNEGTAKLSALSQGVGYLIGASGPVAIGVLRDVTGSWRAPLLVLLVLLIPQVICGLIAGREGHVDTPGPR